jgi:holo-[acyl-carrier protein] synthase
MSRLEIGIDLIEIARIVHVLGRFPQRFRQRVLTEAEQRYCGNRVERIAGRWAAKEAVSKVLGLGVRGVGWREIEVLPDRAGKPHVFLHDRAARRAASMGITEIAVSITHERSMAAATAVGERGDPPARGERWTRGYGA